MVVNEMVERGNIMTKEEQNKEKTNPRISRVYSFHKIVVIYFKSDLISSHYHF